jgi:hypothetical protein
MEISPASPCSVPITADFYLALEFSIHLHSSPCMHGLGSNHGLTLLVIGSRIGSDWNSVPINANQPRQAIPAAVVARARAAGIEGPLLSRWRRLRLSNCQRRLIPYQSQWHCYRNTRRYWLSRAGVCSQALLICYNQRQLGRMGDASMSPPACLGSRLLASRSVSATLNSAVTIASLWPGEASRRLDFKSTIGGGPYAK